MADMKRNGYKEEMGLIGDALLAVRAADAAVKERKEEFSAAGLTRAFLKDNPDGVFNTDRIYLHVLAKKPGASKVSIQQALGYMVSNEEITRVGRGEYRYGAPARQVVQAVVESAPTAPVSKIGEFTGDPAVDADLAMLDEALAALGQIEDVVNRNRERLFALAQFKKLLGG